jgi:imidazole glycerol phosphate synthase glutamine amidotransferase subunit
MTIGIVDYGMGNLGSVTNACRFLELPAEIVTAPEGLDACAALILPGVGAFGDCMRHLEGHGFVEPLRAWIAADRPFLGICLGLQVLFEGGEESPDTPGLGILPGMVRRFPEGTGLKVPQIGWNRVAQQPAGAELFRDIADGSHFYFVHSYFVDTPDRSLAAGVTEYGTTYVSAVARGRLMAVQFHPEKSQRDGLTLLGNFARLAAVGSVVS